jgi:hypothetical protein
MDNAEYAKKSFLLPAVEAPVFGLKREFPEPL